MATTPIDITAEVSGLGDGSRSGPEDGLTTVRGQVEVATTEGRIESVALEPRDPEACAEAVAAILEADWVFLGPGSWFTSVIPHLMVPGLRAALAQTKARIVVVLNLAAQAGETSGFSDVDHLDALFEHAPDLPAHTVVADPSALDEGDELAKAVAGRGCDLLVADVAVPGEPRHDPVRLADVFRDLLDEYARPGHGR